MKFPSVNFMLFFIMKMELFILWTRVKSKKKKKKKKIKYIYIYIVIENIIINYIK